LFDVMSHVFKKAYLPASFSLASHFLFTSSR
jgi:hypothetical protein